MTTFEESTVNMLEKLINKIGELDGKVSKTEESDKTAEGDKNKTDDVSEKEIKRMVDNYFPNL